MELRLIEGGAPRQAWGNVVETCDMERDEAPSVAGKWMWFDEAVQSSGIGYWALRRQHERGVIWTRKGQKDTSGGPREAVEVYLGENNQPVKRDNPVPRAVRSTRKKRSGTATARRPIPLDTDPPGDWVDAGTGFGSSIGFMVESQLQALREQIDKQEERIEELKDHIATLKRRVV